VALMWNNLDLMRLLRVDRMNLLMIIPIIPLVGSLLRAALRIGNWNGFMILSYAPSAPALEMIVLGHFLLIVLMFVSIVLGIASIYLML
jgi:hypothetical protein